MDVPGGSGVAEADGVGAWVAVDIGVGGAAIPEQAVTTASKGQERQTDRAVVSRSEASDSLPTCLPRQLGRLPCLLLPSQDGFGTGSIPPGA